MRTHQHTTAKDLLMREMRTNPSLLHSITERAPVAQDDDHPDLDHLDAPPCTHQGVTPEHLAVCCRDLDCERCGEPTGINGTEIELGEVVLCGRCQVADMDNGE